MGKHDSTRVDEGKKYRLFLAIKPKARTVLEREKQGLISEPKDYELRLGREEGK